MKRLLTIRLWIAAIGLLLVPATSLAQSEMYPQHFDLEEVTLLDGPMKQAMDINNKLLLRYDADRLLTPFIRQAGLSDKKGSKYEGWTTAHPSFPNWGQPDWSLEGHVGGHYLTALALGYAATHDADMRTQLKERLDYCLAILKDCQDAFDGNTQGMEGFLGGQPINQIWTGLYQSNLEPFKRYGGWVPFYCEHKVLAGLRDAWLYADSELARDMFRKICDWSVNVVSNLSESQMQDILGWEHGGMNEPLADAYQLFGDQKYLTAAKKYSHQYMLNGMQTLNTTFLDGKHANTQVPKYIGFERIYQVEQAMGKTPTATYRTAAHNFWQDVAENRTVCIGGNSVSEHFLPASRGNQYMDNLEGPESCNSNNMLKLSENLFDETHDARYADFYEATTWNHILSTQDPQTGGYVYFTTLRPQGYRIYSRVNQGMWCCVGTGMENHAKYGHFIYTRQRTTDNGQQKAATLYVNLFTASKLENADFALTQETQFPYEPSTRLTINKAGTFTLAIRHPQWAGAAYAIRVNGQAQTLDVQAGTASYVKIDRTWSEGDVVEVDLPMSLRYEECPNYGDYVAFKYGPILLAAQTTATSAKEATQTGLTFESLQNEYGGEGRMDHSPGAMAKALPLSSAALLIGNRSELLTRIKPAHADGQPADLHFTIDVASTQSKGNWSQLTLMPFYAIQHARYQCYWYARTAEEYAKSDMGLADARAAALEARTVDFVATGEQQSEAGHALSSSNSGKGSYNGEFYRDAQSGGWMQYTLQNKQLLTDSMAIMCRFTTADKGRVGTIYIDGDKLTDVTIPSSVKNAESNGFYNIEYEIPKAMMLKADGTPKSEIVFKFVASGTTPIPGLYYLRLMRGYDAGTYRFVCTDWKTGDANRVAQNNISYDTDLNTITVKASGNNNVCLMLDYEHTDYNVKGTDKYLVVKGSGLSLSSGKNYLWWLNGCNRGSSVAPTKTAVAADKDRVVAWDITQSGIADNCTGDLWNLSTGMTIFGLTATSGTAIIKYIGFTSDVNAYLDQIAQSVAVDALNAPRSSSLYYTPTGIPHTHPLPGINIVDGKKVLYQ